MEKLHFHFKGQQAAGDFKAILVGVVGSGNLEVMLEPRSQSPECSVDITTSARGFASIWEAVMQDFQDRHRLSGLAISINDMGATPAVVSLRLDQAAAALPAGSGAPA